MLLILVSLSHFFMQLLFNDLFGHLRRSVLLWLVVRVFLHNGSFIEELHVLNTHALAIALSVPLLLEFLLLRVVLHRDVREVDLLLDRIEVGSIFILQLIL